MSEKIISVLLGVGLVIATLALMTFVVFAIYSSFQSDEKTVESGFQLREVSFSLIEQNTLRAITSPVFVKTQVLGMVIDEPDYDQAELLDRIAECESDWRNICNAKGCEYGQGIFQLIPTTVKYCEEKLGKEIDPFDEEESRECAAWLLTNEGPGHWGCSTCDWGTYHCWSQ